MRKMYQVGVIRKGVVLRPIETDSLSEAKDAYLSSERSQCRPWLKERNKPQLGATDRDRSIVESL